MNLGDALQGSEITILPQFIYSCNFNTNELYVTNLLTGKCCLRKIPSFLFKGLFSSWCALPYHYICFTGGSEALESSKEVVMFDTHREYSALRKASMITPRRSHISIWHEGFLYVFSGISLLERLSRECERYSFVDNQWESIPPIPVALHLSGAVTLDANRSVYVVGGNSGKPRDLIQELSLESLKWRELELRLPSPASCLSVFKVCESECYFALDRVLYCFVPLTSQIHKIKTLSENIQSYCGPSYYSQGTLYCTNYFGAVKMLAVGSLS